MYRNGKEDGHWFGEEGRVNLSYFSESVVSYSLLKVKLNITFPDKCYWKLFVCFNSFS